MSRLVLVPTPLGNLGDITLRALEVLKSADLILAEDTRTSGKLLSHYGISARLKAFHLHNEHKFLEQAITLIKSHELVVLVSDAGTPGISDPGFMLVRACKQNNIPVECLPGPAALIPALVVSGFPTDRFCFEGFLPHKKGRQTKLKEIAEETRTIVFYESPHRLLKTLSQCAEFIGGQREAAVIREISKIHEECVNGTFDELVAHFTKTPPRGEIVLVIKGLNEVEEEQPEEQDYSDAELFSRGLAKRKKA
jgi:16S rRNA (cytidine1402-2'-O)-methyltransferase